MEIAGREVEIRPVFQESFDEILHYLQPHSHQQFERFKKDIVPKILAIVESPFAFPEVRELKTKQRWYRRAPYKKSYRIYYKVLAKKVIILDIQHQRRDPENLQKLRKKK